MINVSLFFGIYHTFVRSCEKERPEMVLEQKSTKLGVTAAMIGYSICSSTLLLANKLALAHLPVPGVVSLIQIVSSVVFVYAIKLFGVKVDAFEWDKVKAFSVYILAFVLAIYANMQALRHSNVETVIVFRACAPMAVSLVEYLFMGRTWPSLRSSLSLATVACGALLYCLSDSQFAMNGLSAYTWVVLYFGLITFEMTYGKKLTSAVKMDSVWGSVLYTNVLAVLPMCLLCFCNGDFVGVGETLQKLNNDGEGILIIAFSCLAGTMIGFMGWQCRGMVSATTYTLVGVVNKFLTLLLNVLVWEKHSSPFGLCAVCLCLLAGAFYEQAPMRIDHDSKIFNFHLLNSQQTKLSSTESTQLASCPTEVVVHHCEQVSNNHSECSRK
jgi:GDP-mannose transporter